MESTKMSGSSIRSGVRLDVGSALRLAVLSIGLLGFVLLSVPGTALAEEGAREPNVIPCLCRFDGAAYEQGQCVCIPTSNGPRRACCGKVLNNSSWMFADGACQLAEVAAPGGDPRITRSVGARD